MGACDGGRGFDNCNWGHKLEIHLISQNFQYVATAHRICSSGTFVPAPNISVI